MNLDLINQALDSEAAKMASSQNFGDSRYNSRAHWVLDPPYTWENSFTDEWGPYQVRWIPHADKLPGGVKISGVHTLMNSPNDPKPRKYYCKESFFVKGEGGVLEPARKPDGTFHEGYECHFCDVLEAINPIFDTLSGLPPVDKGGYSGEAVAECIKEMGSKRTLLIPMIVRAERVQQDDGEFVFKPTTDPEQEWGILLATRPQSSLWKSFTELAKEAPNLGSWGEDGRWMNLKRVPAGQYFKSVLTPILSTEALSSRGVTITKEYPDIATWGEKAPQGRSKRTTLNITAREQEHFFKNTDWYKDLTAMTDDEIDWDD